MSETLTSVSAASPAPARSPAAGATQAVHPFRAILRKTFLETFYVTIGAWCVVLFWVAEELYSTTSGFTMPARHRDTLMDPAALWLASLGCAALGLVLAIVQFRTMRAFDQWALLVHRPVSRSWLFLYSSAAGLVIYAVTVAVPLTIFLCWAISNPKATPTFYLGFLYPYAAAAINGVVCYFCGALIIQRQARWFATRFLPLFGGVLFFALTLLLRNFSAVLLAELVGVVVFALAAWGSTVSQGYFRKVPFAARAGLVLTLSSGCVVFAFFIVPLWKTAAESYVDAYHPLPWTERYVSAAIEPLTDGTLGLRVRTYKLIGSGTYKAESEEVRSLADAPLPDAKVVELTGSAFIPVIPGKQYTYSYRSVDSITRWSEQEGPYRAPEFVGDIWAGLNIPPGERVEGFGDVQLFWDPDGPPPTDLLRMSRFRLLPEIVATDKHLYFYNLTTRATVAVVPATRSLHDFALRVHTSADDNLILLTYFGGPPRNLPWYNRLVGDQQDFGYMELYDVSGKLLSTAAFNAEDPILQKYNKGRHHVRQQQLRPLAFLGGLFQGAGMLVWQLPLSNWLNISMISGSYFDVAGAITFNFLTAVVLTFLARRYRLSWRVAIGWGLASFILGPLVLIVFAGVYHRPVRVPCRTCGTRRPVNEEVCPKCRVPFAGPPANGTEIFSGS